MADYSWILSTCSLLLSGTTAWLTLGRRGRVKMTKPTVISFLNTEADGPKVYLRTLLRSTAQRGNVIESMYVRVRRHESGQNFNVWVYGEKQLSRGSGLFVGKEGIVCNHHFMPPKDATEYKFAAGEYVIEVYATMPDQKQPTRLLEQKLILSPEHAAALAAGTGAGVHFDWGPDSGNYFPHVPVRRQLKAANEEEMDWELEGSVLVRLLPNEGYSVTFKDNQTDVLLLVGIRNIIPLPIAPRRLMLRWDVEVGSFHKNELKEVVDEFPVIQPYAEYPIKVPIQLPPHHGDVRELAATHIGGSLFGAIEGFPETKKAQVANFSWARVRDERKR